MAVLLLDKERSGMVIVDVQAKLMRVMRRKETVVENIIKLLNLCGLFSLPVIVTEQYPRMMGSTLPEIKKALPVFEPLEKMYFNCCAVSDFNDRLRSAALKNIILTGAEAHICILQTCLTLLEQGCNVHVPRDAVDSRTEENWQTGLDMMQRAGAVITSTETIIYQILKRAGTPEFKKMLKMIK
jgi:nicotinamidase-related amidase